MSSDGPDSPLAEARGRGHRRLALVVMLSSLLCLVVLSLILWHLVTGRILPAWDDSTREAGGAPALAVLPFQSASDGEPLGDEVAEDLIARLSKLDYFPVATRDESFAYRTGAIDAKRVGRALDVRYVVEGYVRSAEHRIHLRVRVFDAWTARLVWAEEHEIERAELALVERRLARLIASAVLRDARPGP